jgi:hypothetical protein
VSSVQPCTQLNILTCHQSFGRSSRSHKDLWRYRRGVKGEEKLSSPCDKLGGSPSKTLSPLENKKWKWSCTSIRPARMVKYHPTPTRSIIICKPPVPTSECTSYQVVEAYCGIIQKLHLRAQVVSLFNFKIV